MMFLNALISGSKPSLIPLHFTEIVTTLTDPFVIDPSSATLCSSALDVILTTLAAMEGRGKAAIEAFFLGTGRLTSLQSTIDLTFRTLVTHLARCSPLTTSTSSGASSGYTLDKTSAVVGVGQASDPAVDKSLPINRNNSCNNSNLTNAISAVGDGGRGVLQELQVKASRGLWSLAVMDSDVCSLSLPALPSVQPHTTPNSNPPIVFNAQDVSPLLHTQLQKLFLQRSVRSNTALVPY